ncbi:flagellar hook capping protein [Lachnospiraceae bacterium ZAX-1]
MALSALVENGKLVDTSAASQSRSTAAAKNNNGLGKEAFLQLLVAQMKYQDPLEPTSNTEYISQLATFSSLEEMQNLNATVTGAQAANLVGKQVMLKVMSPTTGETTYVTGKVDYMVRENGKVFLSVKDRLYSIDDLDSVVDESYMDAVTLADVFKKMVEALPKATDLTIEHKAAVATIRKAYDSMTEYQKQFVSQDLLATLEKAEEKMKELQALEDAKTPEDADTPDEEEIPDEEDAGTP